MDSTRCGMKCMFCDNPATVHLTDIVNKKKREAHLCERCARERNLLPDPPGPQIDLTALMNLLLTPFNKPAAELAASPDPSCPACGLTYAAFKAEGRFGCAHDYDAFRRCWNRSWSASTGRPRTPASGRSLHAAPPSSTSCSGSMKSAIAAEDYEEAARLRDLIRQKEAEGTPG